MASRNLKARLLVLIVAHNAEHTIAEVVHRIPRELLETFDVHVLIIDDASQDATFVESYKVSKSHGLPFPVRVLCNSAKQGYGANQKLGYHYAIERAFDLVALMPGDGQYASECLPGLLEPLRMGRADAVFGAGTMGIPPYRFVGTRILTWIENRLLHVALTGSDSAYRLYSVAALRAIPFERNSNSFQFDTEIVIQLLIARRQIEELPIPVSSCKSGRARGIRDSLSAVATAIKARLQEMSLFYDRRFDCAPADTYSPYTPKFNYESVHTLALDRVRQGSRVLDLGCAGGYLGARLRQRKHCSVTGMDKNSVGRGVMDHFETRDLNAGAPHIDANRFDAVLMLDVIEHLNRPEQFLEELCRQLAANPSLEFMISTANVACFATRLMLLIGQFNYGLRGILDVTHTRLFTFTSLRRALTQAGFEVVETKGVPAPFPLAIGDNMVSRSLLAVNRFLIRLSRGLFAYQIFMRVKAQPSLEALLAGAERESASKRASIGEYAAAGCAGVTHAKPIVSTSQY
jgi:2-polyprenyl-3-methyl-5-hydroxy-6-metoxy-1,4-benzoquinol methylase